MRLFLDATISLIACAQFAVVSAQVPSQRPAIKLGMTGAEVRKILGTPMMYRYTKTNENISNARVMPPSSDYHDIYQLRTSQNTYELRIDYVMDDSESRLHPTARVFGAHFELDRRVGLNDLAKVLGDLPELAALCGEECTIAGRSGPASVDGLPLYYLHPGTMTAAGIAEAERIGSLFGKFPAGEMGVGERKPTIWIIAERESITEVMISEDDSGRLEGPVRATWKPQISAK